MTHDERSGTDDVKTWRNDDDVDSHARVNCVYFGSESSECTVPVCK